MTAMHDKLFARIVNIAVAGERCPFNEHLPTGGLSALAREGKLRIEVFRHNWRVVTILVGEHTGKKTKQDPALEPGARPYVVIDARSPAPRKEIALVHRQQPWTPGQPKPGKAPA